MGSRGLWTYLFLVLTCICIGCKNDKKNGDPKNMEIQKETAKKNKISRVLFVSDPWPPYTLGEEAQAAEGGISIELCREIFSRLNIGFSSKLYPWNRVLLMLENGKGDLTFPLIKTAEREEFLLFTDVVMEDRDVVWYLADRKTGPVEWETPDDLTSYSIGIVDGYEYGEQIEAALKKRKFKVERARSYEQAIVKLIGERMDIFIGTESVILDLIKNNPEWKGKLAYTKKSSNTNIYRIGISKKSLLAGMVPEINEVIETMKQDGTIDRIIGK